MKKSNALLSGAVLLWAFTSSCTKNLEISEVKEDAPKIVSVMQLPSSTVHITLASNGEYISSYGGGITFSQTFSHPTVVDPTGLTDGEPVASYSFVNFSFVPTLSSLIDGARFVIIQPTFPGAITVTDQNNYFSALRNYWHDTTGTVPRPAPIGSTTGAGGVIEISGIVVIDHTSPTNVSVVADTYRHIVINVD